LIGLSLREVADKPSDPDTQPPIQRWQGVALGLPALVAAANATPPVDHEYSEGIPCAAHGAVGYGGEMNSYDKFAPVAVEFLGR
jgi:hypothetical protein